MNTIKSLWLLFALISTCSADCCKKTCRLDHEECVTKGGNAVYENVTMGVENLIPPMNPLDIDELSGVYDGSSHCSGVKYNLTNITIIGLTNCGVTKLIVNVTDNIYKLYLHCPKLIINSYFQFEAEEYLDTPALCGTGAATVTAYNYDILNTGKYGVFVNNDHRPHYFIKTHESRLHLKGKLTIAITNAFIVDSRSVNENEQCMNNHCIMRDEILHEPSLTKSMDILMDHWDIYIRTYPMHVVLPFHH